MKPLLAISLAGFASSAGGCGTSTLEGGLDSPLPTARLEAIREAERRDEPTPETLRRLVEQLDSDDAAVRWLAISALERMTGETYGYRYDDAVAERRRAIERWKAHPGLVQCHGQIYGSGRSSTRLAALPLLDVSSGYAFVASPCQPRRSAPRPEDSAVAVHWWGISVGWKGVRAPERPAPGGRWTMPEEPRTPDLAVSLHSQPRLLAPVRALAGSFAARLGFDEIQCGQISLAIDEALCNVINHGYDRRPDGPIWISIWDLETTPPSVKIVIEDRARQVDLENIRSRDLDDIRPGGLGVYIIREIMDDVLYEQRNGGGMRLSMTKRRRETRGNEAAEVPSSSCEGEQEA